MADNEKNINNEEEEYLLTLTDEVTGEERDFELYARATIDGKDYFALAATDGSDGDDFIVLRGAKSGEDIFFETIDDDDEFDKVEDYFNDLLFNEVNYDDVD